MPARLVGGTFTGELPLVVGSNRIVATATSMHGQVRESVVEIAVRDASCGTLEVNALRAGQPALSLNERNVEIMVDASRSMWGQIDGEANVHFVYTDGL